MKINLELSEKLAEIVEAENKSCYINSVKALLIFGDSPEARNPMYVEGCAIAFLPESHGWIENGDEIIDVTYFGRNFRYNHNRSFEPHEPVEKCTYFPGQKYSFEEVREIALNLRKLPLFEFIKGEAREKQVEALKTAYASLGLNVNRVRP